MVDSRKKVLTAVVGSHLHGNARPDSDLDLRSVHIEPTLALTGLGPPPPTTKTIAGDADHVSWEVGFLCKQALQGEMNSIEILYAEDYPHKAETYEANELFRIRDDFLSQRIRKKWLGFADKQLKLIDRGITRYHNEPDVDPVKRIKKPAFHLIRTIDALGTAWETGGFNPRHPHPENVTQWIDENWKSLMFVATLQTVVSEMSKLTEGPTPLPEEPRLDRIDQYIRNIRATHFFVPREHTQETSNG
ncbi:nucleotidyltransferase [Gordonia phage BrutonGaster]|uniref:Nucleotidyltransferase n=1 Tax=Gordonia phage BrutonGaster TaxID=2530116 RepID=A0A482JKP7_9CAUD|nr:nucleotidyltransferase [Gordonia phage BrutonGaster]QBP33326.1 nucleotidyltransferase [Gordonia phage BrutonGaster]